MNFNNMFQTWINVLTKPGEATFEAERQNPNANLTTALLWIAAATVIVAIFSAIGALISGFISGGSTMMQSFIDQADLPPEVAAQMLAFTAGTTGGGIVGAFCVSLILTPIFFLIGSGIYLVVAKLLGGAGGFEEQTYLLATFHAPLMAISAVVGVVPFLGGCLSFLVFIYQVILTYFAVKVVHRLGTGQALVVALTPVVLLLLCIICLIAGVFAIAFSAASTAR